MMTFYNGMSVTVSTSALALSEERLFPESKHRSKRIRKKLIKRFGGEFKSVPACYNIEGRLVIHPVLWEELQSQLKQP